MVWMVLVALIFEGITEKICSTLHSEGGSIKIWELFTPMKQKYIWLWEGIKVHLVIWRYCGWHPAVYNTCLTKVLKENNVSELSLHDCLLNSYWSFSFSHHTLYVFQRFYGLQWLLTEETERLSAGLVTGAALGVRASKVGLGFWYGLVLLKISWLDLFRLERSSKSTFKASTGF